MKKRILKLTIVTLAAVFTLSCQTSVSPDLPADETPVLAEFEPNPIPISPPNPNLVLPYRGDWLETLPGKISVSLENNSSVAQWLGLACYSGPRTAVSAQVLPEPKEAYFEILRVEARQVFEVLEPCGEYQCDAFWGLRRPRTPPFYGDHLLFGKYGNGTENCLTPTCENCPPPPPPECEPPGEPLCPELVWDTILCSWVGECICEPTGTAECPEQVWDTTLCAWVGECPCVEEECSFGYEWSEDICACSALDVCHVSNGGQPGECDWQLREQNKKFNPGHGRHLDPANQCPPDYFGLCDGRYLTTPHDCQCS